MQVPLSLPEVHEGSEFHLKSKHALPEKQSQRVFAQASSAHLDDLRDMWNSSQTLTTGYQTFRAICPHFTDASQHYPVQPHKAQLYERKHQPGM